MLALRRVSQSSPEELSDSSEDEEKISFFRWFKPRQINDSVLSDRATQDQIDEELGVPSNWVREPPQVKGYIDDFNIVEKVRLRDSITHFTTSKSTSLVHAPGQEALFKKLGGISSDMGMVINQSKTQTLCISPATHSKVKSYINLDGERIQSGPTLKILGFSFDERPGVHLHVELMLNKVRNKLWTLRHLKRSGLSQDDLLGIYKSSIRPILDFACPTYHLQLTSEMSCEIESLQADAMKIIFGRNVSYQTVLDHNKIEEHRIRRQNIASKFALKNLANEKFSEKWFPRNPTPEYNLRNVEPYVEYRSRTERYRKSPLQHMRRLLNQNHRPPQPAP